MGWFGKNKKKRKYEGAARTSRTSGWITGLGDANSQIKAALPTLRARSRDLRRNNPYIHAAIELIANNVVGKGIVTKVNDDGIEGIWADWAYSTDIDYDGRNDFKGLQRMVMEAVVESGEVLVRKRFVSGMTVPIQYQVLEADFLDNTILTVKPKIEGNRVIQGIEFDSNGKRVGYHIYTSHPGSIDLQVSSLKTIFIPATEMLHIFRAERPGQVRGVPWAAPVMIKVKDLGDFEDAQLMRQKVAACFTAFVQDINAEVECDDKSDLGKKIQPAAIEELPPGKTVTFAKPPGVENYHEFTSAQLRAIATGMGITYEGMAKDYSNVNFSSGRMGFLEMGRNVDVWRDGIMLNQLIKPIVKDFKSATELMGVDASRSKFTHIPPRREMIDPTKEIPALQKAVRSGFMSQTSAITSSGENANEVFEQIKKDNDKLDELGIVLDTDPRKVNINGKSQDSGVKDNEQEND